MLAVIPILGFLLILAVILTATNKYSRRESILLACVVWGVGRFGLMRASRWPPWREK